MSDNIIQLNEDLIKHDLKDPVRSSVEETLNALLDKEADELVSAQKYERSGGRPGYRSGHYKRNFQTTAGKVELNVPRLKGVPFGTAITEHYRRRKSPVEAALTGMYPASVSLCRVENITEALWRTKVSPGTISSLNRKAYEHIGQWHSRPLSDDYPCVCAAGVYLKRSQSAIGVNSDGFWEIIGAAGGIKEDKESWRSFFVWLKERGLSGIRLIIGDKNPGILETIPEVFPDACCQRCTVHFCRNIFFVTPLNKIKAVAVMLKAAHTLESREAAKTTLQNGQVVRLSTGIEVTGSFLDEQDALMIVYVRLCYITKAQGYAFRMNIV